MVKKYNDDIDYSKRYLTFEAIENGVFSFYKRGGTGTIQYSLDNGDTWCVLEDYHNIYLLAGQCVWWKGNLRGNIKSVDDYKPEKATTNPIDGGLNIGIGRFVSTGKYNAMGNIMSLLYEDDFIGKTDMLYPCMFAGTFAGMMGPTQLTQFPEGNCIVDASNLYLPAKKITGGGYYGMFAGCKYLTKAPRILATEVSYACCYVMFMRCDSLTTTPTLYSKTLIPCCYLSMFYECPNIHNIVMLATGVMRDKVSEDNGITTDSIEELTAIALSMMIDENSTGIMSLNSNSNISNYINSALPSGWTTDIYSGETKPLKKWFDGIERNYSYSSPSPLEKQYLTFKVLSEGSFSFSRNNIDYSLDSGSTWTTLTAGSSTPTITAGSKVMWRAMNPTISSPNGIGTFSSTGYYNVEGNIMSLLYGSDFIKKVDLTGFNLAFYNLFKNSTKLINASDLILPAITLSNFCYYGMFNGCSSLISTPKLPAVNLTIHCYGSMFNGCSKLTSAPELPATNLTSGCYNSMFNGCSKLTSAPELPATKLADDCYYSMFEGCTSLTIAPELPATNLAESCYQNMFNGCSSLTSVPELPATNLADYCYNTMFQNCKSLTTAQKILPATTLADYCYHYMFNGCSKLTTAPELPATTLVNTCYGYMFSGCSKLNNITMLATDISASWCLSNWVYGVASTGTFTKAASMTSLPTGSSGIPNGWTVVNK